MRGRWNGGRSGGSEAGRREGRLLRKIRREREAAGDECTKIREKKAAARKGGSMRR